MSKGEDIDVELDSFDEFICDECGGLDGEHEDDCDTGANLVADEDQDGYEEEEND